MAARPIFPEHTVIGMVGYIERRGRSRVTTRLGVRIPNKRLRQFGKQEAHEQLATIHTGTSQCVLEGAERRKMT